MLFLSKDLSTEEKNIYLNCLSYILSIGKSGSMAKKEYMESQICEIGLDKGILKSLKKKQKPEDIIKDIKGICDIRVKRFLLREMILLAIADHELADEEIQNIYKIGTKSGIKEEKISDLFLWAARGIEWQIEGTQLVEEDL